MKKLLLLTLSFGTVLRLSAANVQSYTTAGPIKKISVSAFDPVHGGSKQIHVEAAEETDAAKKKNDAFKATADDVNKKLQQAGLYKPQQPVIEAALSCKTGKLQSMPLTTGFVLSFCSNSNVDFTAVDKAVVLKLLVEQVEAVQDFRKSA